MSSKNQVQQQPARVIPSASSAAWHEEVGATEAV
jgi:hypothetical protein